MIKQGTISKKKIFSLPTLSQLLCCGLIAVFFSCKKNDNNNVPPPSNATVAIVNTAPKVPYFDVYVSNTKKAGKIEYLHKPGTAEALNYIAFSAGNNIDLSLKDSVNAEILKQNIALTGKNTYSLIIYDTLSATVKKVKPLLLTDDLNLPGNNKTNFRFLHLSPTTTPVDVVLCKKNGEDSIKLVPTMSYIGSNNSLDTKALSKFSTIASGKYWVKVKTQENGKTKVLVDESAFEFASNKVLTIYLKGLKGYPSKHKYGLYLQAVQNK